MLQHDLMDPDMRCKHMQSSVKKRSMKGVGQCVAELTAMPLTLSSMGVL